jgi:hypothetical protein
MLMVGIWQEQRSAIQPFSLNPNQAAIGCTSDLVLLAGLRRQKLQLPAR